MTIIDVQKDVDRWPYQESICDQHLEYSYSETVRRALTMPRCQITERLRPLRTGSEFIRISPLIIVGLMIISLVIVVVVPLQFDIV
jgi:hypothetical protein